MTTWSELLSPCSGYVTKSWQDFATPEIWICQRGFVLRQRRLALKYNKNHIPVDFMLLCLCTKICVHKASVSSAKSQSLKTTKIVCNSRNSIVPVSSNTYLRQTFSFFIQSVSLTILCRQPPRQKNWQSCYYVHRLPNGLRTIMTFYENVLYDRGAHNSNIFNIA